MIQIRPPRATAAGAENPKRIALGREAKLALPPEMVVTPQAEQPAQAGRRPFLGRAAPLPAGATGPRPANRSGGPSM